jgi:hypothetical protein
MDQCWPNYRRIVWQRVSVITESSITHRCSILEEGQGRGMLPASQVGDKPSLILFSYALWNESVMQCRRENGWEWQIGKDIVRIGPIYIRRCNIMGVGTMVTRRNVVNSRPYELDEFSSLYLILPAALGSGVYSASNRNEYQRLKNNISWQ